MGADISRIRNLAVGDFDHARRHYRFARVRPDMILVGEAYRTEATLQHFGAHHPEVVRIAEMAILCIGFACRKLEGDADNSNSRVAH